MGARMRIAAIFVRRLIRKRGTIMSNPRKVVALTSVAIGVVAIVALHAVRAQSDAQPLVDAREPSSAINVSYNSGRSVHPVIRADPMGHLHLAWMDNTSGNFEIFYSTWSGTKWSKTVNISNNETLSLYPAMAIDAKGHVHVTWMDGERADDLDVQHSQLVKSKWSKPKNISNMKGISQRPQIEVDSSGVVHVIWYDNQGGFFELYHCRLVKGEWLEPTNTGLVDWHITHNPRYSRRPAITADHKGGIHLVWVGMEDVPSPYALCQNIRHSYWDGNQWANPDNVSRRQSMQGNLEDPVMAADARGTLHVSWEDRAVVWYCHWDGKQWSKSGRVNDKSRKSALPAVCASKSGRVHFAWLNAEQEEPDVYYRELNGLVWSKPVNVTNNEALSLYHSMVIDSRGQVHVTWMDERTGEYEIFHRHFVPHD